MTTRPIPENLCFYCLSCGYILNPTPGNRCPSCGRAFHRSLRSSVCIPPSTRLTQRGKWLSRLALFTLMGFILSVACYVIVVRGAYQPLTRSWHPYVTITLAFVTLLPASLYLGSWVTGLLIQPYCQHRVREALLFSPGMVLFGVCLYYWLPDRSLMFIAMMSGLGIGWVYVSTLGVLSGMAFGLRREADLVAALEQEEKLKDEATQSPSALQPPEGGGDHTAQVKRWRDYYVGDVTETQHRRAA